MHAITADNGSGFVEHEKTTEELGAEFFLTHLCQSWEHGLNEKFHELLRQYILKGVDMRTISDEFVRWAGRRLNLRPQKCHSFKLPEAIFRERVQTA